MQNIMTEQAPAIVYMATNLVNGKRYIGITKKTLAERRYRHVYMATCSDRPLKFWRAIRKYGSELFRFSTLMSCASIEDAKAQERRLIVLLAPEYNLTMGGDGVWGLKHTAESLAKMSAARKGKPGTFLGRKLTDEHKANIRAYYANLSTDDRRALVERARAAAVRPANKVIENLRVHQKIVAKARRKKVIRIDTGEVFESINAAATVLGIHPMHVSRYCTRKFSRRDGMSLRFFDEQAKQ